MSATPKEYTFDSLPLQQRASFEHIVQQKDVDAFADVSGDRNPLHTDAAFASRTQFKEVVVHGMYLGALLSRMIGMELPGLNSLLGASYLEFKKPVRVGDSIRVEGVVTHKSAATRIAEIELTFSRTGELVATGNARVQLLK